ncbi:MAG: 4-oxalocrotonate tautomerase family protein [Firmicutes bacterium]|nr:4-oxalocrotonate tautomerase family protein [Bacillota bacterium]
MPVIHFNGPLMPKERKAALVLGLTRAAREVLPDIPEQAFTVIIHENNPDNVGVGGQLLSDRPKPTSNTR